MSNRRMLMGGEADRPSGAGAQPPYKPELGPARPAPAAQPQPREAGKFFGSGRIFAVGIGPGDERHLTPAARAALEAAEVIVGYRPYCQQVGPLIAGKKVLASGMRAEVARCRRAIAEASAGRIVAVLSSGDAGIYGMAGLLLELLGEDDAPLIEVEVVPGLSAALTAAAALGAPLANDCCLLSLSDLLTPREEILRRLAAVAPIELVCCLYNPASTTRRDLLDLALDGFLAARGRAVPAGLVHDAGRADQQVWLGALADLPRAQVSMNSLVVVGHRRTAIIRQRLVTRRGYPLVDDDGSSP